MRKIFILLMISQTSLADIPFEINLSPNLSRPSGPEVGGDTLPLIPEIPKKLTRSELIDLLENFGKEQPNQTPNNPHDDGTRSMTCYDECENVTTEVCHYVKVDTFDAVGRVCSKTKERNCTRTCTDDGPNA